MTILERSQTRYVVEVKYSRWWLLVTVVCLWLGVSLIRSGTITSLTCHRIESNDGQCEYSRRKLLETEAQTFNLARVTEATLYTATRYTDKNGKQYPEYHVALVIDQAGSLEIYANTNLSAQQSLADNINGYLANPGRIDLNISRDEATDVAALGVLISAIGVWWAANLLKTTTYTLDKSSGTLTIQSRLLWTRLQTYALTQVLGLYIHETESYNKNRSPQRQIRFILRGQTNIATSLPPNDEDLIHDLRRFLDRSSAS